MWRRWCTVPLSLSQLPIGSLGLKVAFHARPERPWLNSNNDVILSSLQMHCTRPFSISNTTANHQQPQHHTYGFRIAKPDVTISAQ